MKPSGVPPATPEVMEASDVGDLWRCRPIMQSIPEDSNRVSYHPSTSSSILECSSLGERSNTSDGLISHQPHDTKWWLLMQPDLQQQLNTLEAEISAINAGYVTGTTKFCNNQQSKEFGACECMEDDTNSSLLPPLSHHSRDLQSDNLNCLAATQTKKLSTDMDSPWMGSEKAGPWWRSMNKDELASLVAQKSLECIENCDLPEPQQKHSREQPSDCLDYIDHRTAVDLISERGLRTRKFPTSPNIDERDCTACDSDCIHNVLDWPYSGSCCETLDEDQTNQQEHSVDNFSTSQLLEALCHSQTRARKAEAAAQKAHTEKEHIVTLVFRQASQLFAYRQWLQLLQLESLYLQLKNGALPAPDLFPGVLSWVPQKGKMQVNGAPDKKGKRRRGKCRSAVALALDLGLTGTGFLLGWTMGWFLFSSFIPVTITDSDEAPFD